jgi:iron complex outermembrane recepter protein
MMKKTFALTRITLAVVCATTCFSVVSHAQTGAGADQIEEITVTARKRQETLQEVPVAVSVFTDRMIEALGVEGIEDLSKVTPGLVASSGANNSSGTIYLRGIGSGPTSPFMQTTVSIVIDGVQIDNGDILQTGMLDLQQIEVLKGPQALFYGKNSPGGVVTVHTKDPGDHFEAMISPGYEIEADEKIVKGFISGPITETLGARLAISYTDKKGDIDIDTQDATIADSVLAGLFPPGLQGLPIGWSVNGRYPKEENTFVRGSLLWQPTDNFEARTKFTYNNNKIFGSLLRGAERVLCPLGAPQILVGSDDCKSNGKITQGGMDPSVFARGIFKGDPSESDGISEADAYIGSLEMNYELPDPGLVLTSITGYFNNKRFDQIEGSQQIVSILPLTRGVKRTTYSQEFRVASNWDKPVNFMLGTFYSESKDDAFYDVWLSNLGAGFAGAFSLGLETVEQESDAFSVFGQVDWDLTDLVNVSVGSRYSRENKQMDFVLRGAPVQLAPDDESWDNVSSEVTIRYTPRENLMFYASYKQGFKSGGLDGSYQPTFGDGLPHNILFDEEEVDGFEIGMKAQFMDSVTFNIAAFDYKYDNFQMGAFDPVTLTSRVVNAASASVSGVELDGIWDTPIDGLRVWGNLNYLDATYDDFVSDCYLGQSIAAGCNLTFNGTRFVQADQSGGDLVNAPDWTAGLGIDYEMRVGGEWLLSMGLYETYSSSYATNLFSIPGTEGDSRALTNASLILTSPDEQWKFSIKGNNLTDERYFLNTTEVTATGSAGGTVAGGTRGDIQGYTATGRTVTFAMEYLFSAQ